MNTLDALFPAVPSYRGRWRTIYLEPIIGSGERIAIAIVAIGSDRRLKVAQAIRVELLDCLYGVQAGNIQSMIDWIISSLHNSYKSKGNLDNWNPPFGGVSCSAFAEAADHDIDGIIKQAVRFTASLSNIAMDAEREEEEEQPKRYTEQWAKSICEEIRESNPLLVTYFGKRVQLSESKILTSYGFLKDSYVANFGLLLPTRLSSSLNMIKAKIFDLESLKKSSLLIKPQSYEIIVGSPAYTDPTLTDKIVGKLRDTTSMIEELAHTEGIKLFRAESAKIAADHIEQNAA
ncbi:MAG: hypothetical protein WA987_09915 [Cellvibrio sp.]